MEHTIKEALGRKGLMELADGFWNLVWPLGSGLNSGARRSGDFASFAFIFSSSVNLALEHTEIRRSRDYWTPAVLEAVAAVCSEIWERWFRRLQNRRFENSKCINSMHPK